MEGAVLKMIMNVISGEKNVLFLIVDEMLFFGVLTNLYIKADTDNCRTTKQSK